MHKKALALGLMSIITIPLLSNLATVHAQSPYPLADPIFVPPTPIALPLNPKTDGKTFRPSDRPQSDKPSDRKAGVLGADNRILQESRAFPWSAVGRLDVVVNGEELHQCTGTLISRNLILTNSHCIVDKKTNKPISIPIVFKPAFINNKSSDKATATLLDYGWKSRPQSSAEDWAILKLDKSLGDKYGYLGWRVLDFSDQRIRAITRDQIRLVGYSEDFPKGRKGQTAGVHAGCSIEGIFGEASEKVLGHECDANGGSSGGPMFALFNDGNYYIVGLNSGSNWKEEKSSSGAITNIPFQANRGVQVSRWASQAAALGQRESTKAGN